MNFRGGNAPASLKHVERRGRRNSKVKFPGWKRPGLIEADRKRFFSSTNPQHFRGGNAPASLKPFTMPITPF